ncbi:MAG: ATP-binding protein [Gammaproteobacteria bacterium]|nr:ATP-binding protein [Gammaproteobacteria bacterium]MBU0788171.1 ATP-binding protein [Gammaproteobacteria bacterium]MBU0815332.1 ATP-binding protein [Gammaproteobacteria bacterium]MBU1785560.1 ATP-binding protein [Gammaproteobacteria bacterium]
MRDNGYKNAAYAVAELMDNSIQAGARHVELLCIQKTDFVEQRSRQRIDRIAVLDNGRGMNKEVLRMALQFGNGTNLDPKQQTNMGKFGMGLPASSVSQARRVDVYSWQKGISSTLHTFLDIPQIEKGTLDQVPEPVPTEIPKEWLGWSKEFGESGTLVVWSQIDRCIWRTGKAIIENSEQIIGRMYRKFLVDQKVQIRLACIESESLTYTIDKMARPNDPLYLMSGTSTPSPYDEQPMFEPYPDVSTYETNLPIRIGNQTHQVSVRCSMAKKSAREGGTAGSRDYGTHAAKNVGVSVVRAGRELELDPAWAPASDPRNRWWGVEVEFPPALDEIFGVTNNKQNARNFAETATLNIGDLLKEGKTISALKDEMLDDGDPHGHLLEVAHLVKSNIKQMRDLIDVQLKNQRSRETRHDVNGLLAEKEATEKTRQRQAEGKHGVSDADEIKPQEERKSDIAETLTQQGLSEADANDLAVNAVNDSLKYIFAEASLDSPAFFSVQPRGGTLILTLNTLHPAYSRLVDVLERDRTNQTTENLQERLNNALDGLKLLLMAWARYEDEQDSVRRENAQDARVDWGRIARRFLDRND